MSTIQIVHRSLHNVYIEVNDFDRELKHDAQNNRWDQFHFKSRVMMVFLDHTFRPIVLKSSGVLMYW